VQGRWDDRGRLGERAPERRRDRAGLAVQSYQLRNVGRRAGMERAHRILEAFGDHLIGVLERTGGAGPGEAVGPHLTRIESSKKNAKRTTRGCRRRSREFPA